MTKKKTEKRTPKQKAKKAVSRALEPTAPLYTTNELLQGKYCNVGVVKHTPREFIFDFIWTVENHNLLASRIITNPAHAKELYEALGKNIDRYEKTYGKIEIKAKKS